MRSNNDVYISGPMRNKPRYNFDAFDAAAEWLKGRGFGHIYNPAQKDLDMGFDPDNDAVTNEFLQRAMRWDVEKVLASGYIVLLPGWEHSEGAKLELEVARAVGVRVIEMRFNTDNEPDHLWYSENGDLDARLTRAAIDAYGEAHRAGRPADNEARERVFGGAVRVVDPTTGGAKDSKPAQLGALDPNALLDVATVAGFGSVKYALFNYTRGYAWSLSYNALQRHLLAWASGQDQDEESDLPHLAHAAWHCLALLTFGRFNRGTDDRFPLRSVQGETKSASLSDLSTVPSQ